MANELGISESQSASLQFIILSKGTTEKTKQKGEELKAGECDRADGFSNLPLYPQGKPIYSLQVPSFALTVFATCSKSRDKNLIFPSQVPRPTWEVGRENEPPESGNFSSEASSAENVDCTPHTCHT